MGTGIVRRRPEPVPISTLPALLGQPLSAMRYDSRDAVRRAWPLELTIETPQANVDTKRTERNQRCCL